MTISTFHVGGRAHINAAGSSVAHNYGRKGNKLKRRQEREREAKLYESELQKGKDGGRNNLKI